MGWPRSRTRRRKPPHVSLAATIQTRIRSGGHDDASAARHRSSAPGAEPRSNVRASPHSTLLRPVRRAVTKLLPFRGHFSAISHRSAAIVLGACTSGPAATRSPSSGATTPASGALTPATLTPSATLGSAGSPPASVPPCTAGSLAARGGRQGESGIAHGDVALTNVGHAPCTLSGPPAALVLLRTDGSQLPVVFEPSVQPTAQLVVLRPGSAQAAWLIVYWTNWCGAAPGPLRLRISLGDGLGILVAPFDGPPDYDYVPRCDQPGQPSTLQTEVFAPGPSPSA